MDSSLVHNPDVLECLANLSSDEVFTPPKVVNDMLDMLPQDLFASTTTKFLDPCCKSGIFLREIAKRLIAGTRDQYDSLQSCVDHIFHKQLFGIAITELTSLMSRRSLYCSKDPSCPYSASHFESVDGNIRFKSIQHAWNKGKCRFCGASESEYKRDSDKESHAYEFIHCANMRDLQNELFKTEYPNTYQEKDMHFDVIIGNPPYQMSDGGSAGGAMPIYHKFVETAQLLNSNYICMIIPSRWYAGGRGLDQFRKNMLSKQNIRTLVDYPKSRECFTGVDIAGGVCYFCIDRNYKGMCEYTSRNNLGITTQPRILNEYPIFIRDNTGINIINKIKKLNSQFMDNMLFPVSPFGLRSFVRGSKENFQDAVKLISSDGISYIKRCDIPKGNDIIDKYKVCIGYLNPDRAGVNNSSDGKSNVTTKIAIHEPNTVITETYIIIGCFDTLKEAENCATYIKTKFLRLIVLLTLSSMHITKINFQFVPIQDFSKPWTDAELYEKYGLSQEEIDFIESMIKPME